MTEVKKQKKRRSYWAEIWRLLVRNKGAYLVLLDGAASDNAVKAVSQACETCWTPLVRTPPYELGDAIGKPGRMAVAVTDPGMAKRIIELSQPNEG